LAVEIVGLALLAICSICRMMRGDLGELIWVAIAREAAEQGIVFGSADFARGRRGCIERRERCFGGN
jgi:hypothetical protein